MRRRMLGAERGGKGFLASFGLPFFQASEFGLGPRMGIIYMLRIAMPINDLCSVGLEYTSTTVV